MHFRFEDIARNFVKSNDLDSLYEHSYMNWQVMGNDYFCLHRSPAITVRLYRINAEEASKYFVKSCPDIPPSLAHLHDHKYDFYTFPLKGEIKDFRVAMMEAKDQPEGQFTWDRWSVGENLDIRNAYESPQCAVCILEHRISRGWVIFRYSTEVHTFCVSGTENTIYGSIQFYRQRQRSSLYLPEGEKLIHRGPVYGDSMNYKEMKSCINVPMAHVMSESEIYEEFSKTCAEAGLDLQL